MSVFLLVFLMAFAASMCKARLANLFPNSEVSPCIIHCRMGSFYHSCEDKADSSVWIHKYKPTKASEV
jgi:hypothetical protein